MESESCIVVFEFSYTAALLRLDSPIIDPAVVVLIGPIIGGRFLDRLRDW